jgi:hypothetical protein
MVPHSWMIEELERMRREREEQERPCLHVELPALSERQRAPEREDAPRGPIVIEY